MTDPITDRAAQLLATSEHIIVPLEELYKDFISEGWLSWLELDVFEALLSVDPRFDVLGGLSDLHDFRPSLLAELEVQGFLVGPLVMLRDRAFAPEVVMLDVLNHLEAINYSLETAWRQHSAQELADEAEILHLLLMGDMLERELKHSLHGALFSNPDLLENTEA